MLSLFSEAPLVTFPGCLSPLALHTHGSYVHRCSRFDSCVFLLFCSPHFPAQLSTSSRAQSQLIKSLEAQLDDLGAHLRSFQDRDLPSPEEFRAELSRRERAMAEQLRRAQEEESAWRRQAQAEREEMAKTAATKEAFVAKAVAIHVRSSTH
jgi:hypothetical protein